MATKAVRYTQPLLGSNVAQGYLVAVHDADEVLITQDGVACDVYADNDRTPLENPVTLGVAPGNAGVSTRGELLVYLDAGRGYGARVTVGVDVTVVAFPDISPDVSDVADSTSVIHNTGNETKVGALRVRSGETHVDASGFAPGFANVASTTATLQAAATEWQANGGGKLHLPGCADLTVNGRISLPQLQDAEGKKWTLDGHWCKLRAADGYADAVVGDPYPADTAAVLLGRTLDVHHLNLFGDDETPGQAGLRIIGGQNHHIHKVDTQGLDVGVDAIFCLGALIELCRANNRIYDFLVHAGLDDTGTPLWSDATGSGTASNSTTLAKCRSFGAGGGLKAQFAVFDSHLVVIERCIAEGFAGVDAVLFDNSHNTSAKEFRVRSLHSENFPSEAVVRIRATNGGEIFIEGLRNDEGALLVDGRGSNPTTDFNLTLRSLFGADMFAADPGGGTWIFDFPGGSFALDPATAALWKDGNRPYISARRLSNSTSEPGVSDRSTVVQGWAGGKFVAANGGGVIAGAGAVDGTVGKDGDTWVRKEGGILQRIGGVWTSIPVTSATKTANYVLAAGDPDVIETNVAGANTVTVPPNSTTAFPIGTLFEVCQLGAGQTTIVAGAGVTLRSDGGKLKIAGQYGSVSLRKRAADEWVVAGDLTA